MTQFGVRKFATEGGYTVGWFRCDAATDAWIWSESMYEIHRLEQGPRPTLELLLRYKHPDDRARVEGILRKAMADGQPFTYRHRLIDAEGTSAR